MEEEYYTLGLYVAIAMVILVVFFGLAIYSLWTDPLIYREGYTAHIDSFDEKIRKADKEAENAQKHRVKLQLLKKKLRAQRQADDERKALELAQKDARNHRLFIQSVPSKGPIDVSFDIPSGKSYENPFDYPLMNPFDDVYIRQPFTKVVPPVRFH